MNAIGRPRKDYARTDRYMAGQLGRKYGAISVQWADRGKTMFNPLTDWVVGGT